jgi:hypothetical protein
LFFQKFFYNNVKQLYHHSFNNPETNNIIMETVDFTTKPPTTQKSTLKGGKEGVNALHLAAKEGDVEVLQQLLGAGNTIVNSIDIKNGSIPLDHAAEENNNEAIIFLLKNGGDPNHINPTNGRTALHIASKEGYAEVIRSLITAGAQINLQDFEGNTPLHLACQKGQDETVEYLLGCTFMDHRLKNKEEKTCLHLAAEGGHVPTIKSLLEKGISVNAKDNEKKTALNYAKIRSVTRELLQAGGTRTNTENEKADIEFWTKSLGMNPIRCISYLNNLKRFNDPITMDQHIGGKIYAIKDTTQYVFKQVDTETLKRLLNHK